MVKSLEVEVVATEYVPPPPVLKTTSLRWTVTPPHDVYTGDSFSMELLLEDVSLVTVPMPTPIAGKTVNLYRNGVKIKSGTTNSKGLVSFTDRLTAEGAFSYYAEFEGDEEYRGCEEAVPFKGMSERQGSSPRGEGYNDDEGDEGWRRGFPQQ